MSEVFEKLGNDLDNRSVGMIYQKIIDVMRDCTAIGKDRKSGQGYMFRGVDAVMNELNPLFKKHGVFVVPIVISAQREERKQGTWIFTLLDVEYRFFAADGSYVTARVRGEGADSGDKSSNKAMSVAFKYACFQVLCIPTEEFIDPDADGPMDLSPAAKSTIEKSHPEGVFETSAADKAIAPAPAENKAPKFEITTENKPEPIKCSLCGEPIKATISKGEHRTAAQVAAVTGNKCAECYKLSRSFKGAE
ncbi:MAG TPA: ERF family protein [Oscillospiraceae bacterium]|nr:ERF family protein [Oscillospiraceae bacterium]